MDRVRAPTVRGLARPALVLPLVQFRYLRHSAHLVGEESPYRHAARCPGGRAPDSARRLARVDGLLVRPLLPTPPLNRGLPTRSCRPLPVADAGEMPRMAGRGISPAPRSARRDGRVDQVEQLADQPAGQRGGSGVERRLPEALDQTMAGTSPLRDGAVRTVGHDGLRSGDESAAPAPRVPGRDTVRGAVSAGPKPYG